MSYRNRSVRHTGLEKRLNSSVCSTKSKGRGILNINNTPSFAMFCMLRWLTLSKQIDKDRASGLEIRKCSKQKKRKDYGDHSWRKRKRNLELVIKN